MTKRLATTNPSLISLHADTGERVALCAAIGLDDSDGVPDWIQLLPAGDIATYDGRGPYKAKDLKTIITRSLAAERGMVLDENHSTDIAAPRGESAPARGWITELAERNGGIWGKVDWTPVGRRLMAQKAYRFISPVIIHTAAGEILSIARASLVNKPNLRGMSALHSEQNMDLLAKLIAALKLKTDTSEDALVAAVTSLHAESAAATTALQAQLDPIAEAAGLKKGAKAEEVVTAIGTLKTGAPDMSQQIVALQAELTTVTNSLNTLTSTTARDKATAFVDSAIAAKRVGVSPLRDHYISRHMQDSVAVEKEIGAMPILGQSHTAITPAADPAKGELTPQQKQAASLMGVSEDAYKKTLAAEAQAEAAL